MTTATNRDTRISSEPEQTSGLTVNAANQQKLDMFTGIGWTKVIAPAKVNLHLAIGAKRPDGFHDAVSILHALSIHDTVYVRRTANAPGDGLAVHAEMLGHEGIDVPDIPQESNIAYKAVFELARRIGRNEDEAIDIHIEKCIPTQAGLGGGSSDAAATLVALARFWDVNPTSDAVMAAAQALGSDVAFFLRGGCVYCTGRGDVIDHALKPMSASVVLVKTEAGVSTGAAYRAFDEAPTPIPDPIAQAALEAQDAASLELFNNLAPASEQLLPELAAVRAWLLAQDGVTAALLCGSGSTTFALCADFATACRIAAEARKHGHWARTTTFSPIGALIVPNQ